MITQADVLAVAPELVSLTWWDDLLAYVNEFALGRMARIFLAAHIGTVTKRTTPGPVTSEQAGGVRRSYAIALTRSELGQSSYGLTLWSMLTSSDAHGPVLA